MHSDGEKAEPSGGAQSEVRSSLLPAAGGEQMAGIFFFRNSPSIPRSLARSLPPLISHPLSRLARRWPTPYSMFSVCTSNQRSQLRCSPNQPQMCRRRYLTTGTDGAFPWKTHSSATRPALQHARKITNVTMLIFFFSTAIHSRQDKT